MFTYKKDRFSIEARFVTDLRKCTVRKGVRGDGKGYFEIKDKSNPKGETVQIAFAS